MEQLLNPGNIELADQIFVLMPMMILVLVPGLLGLMLNMSTRELFAAGHQVSLSLSLCDHFFSSHLDNCGKNSWSGWTWCFCVSGAVCAGVWCKLLQNHEKNKANPIAEIIEGRHYVILLRVYWLELTQKSISISAVRKWSSLVKSRVYMLLIIDTCSCSLQNML